MALTKRNYVSGETIITAENLNDIQDSIIELEDKGGGAPRLTSAIMETGTSVA